MHASITHFILSYSIQIFKRRANKIVQWNKYFYAGCIKYTIQSLEIQNQTRNIHKRTPYPSLRLEIQRRDEVGIVNILSADREYIYLNTINFAQGRKRAKMKQWNFYKECCCLILGRMGTVRIGIQRHTLQQVLGNSYKNCVNNLLPRSAYDFVKLDEMRAVVSFSLIRQFLRHCSLSSDIFKYTFVFNWEILSAEHSFTFIFNLLCYRTLRTVFILLRIVYK